LASFEKEKSELSRVLHKIGAMKFGAFKLTSGRISPYYIDLRVVPSFPDAFQRVCNLYVKLLERDLGVENVDRIAGIPTAGMPFASVVAFHMKKPFVYIRSKVKTHGRERRIEGVLMPGNRVLLVDDLITTEEGGKERLRKDGIKLHYLLTAREAATKLYELGAIEEDQLKTILKQTKKK